MKDRKILILTMSCNQPYYQSLVGVVKDTWAKPLIQNKYENINWFVYTSCDKQHPKPMVDFENHMIYVNTGDGLKETYFKTYDAYHLIKDIIDFDYVVRTNASIFVNIDNMIKRCDEVWDENEDAVIGAFEQKYIGNKFDYWLMMGYFFAMRKEYFEHGLCDRTVKRYNEGDILENNDDVVFSRKLQNALGPDYIGKTINRVVEIPWYKANLHTFENKINYVQTSLVDTNDPNVVNDNVIVRIRPPYELNRYEQHEHEKFYELYNALKNGRK